MTQTVDKNSDVYMLWLNKRDQPWFPVSFTEKFFAISFPQKPQTRQKHQNFASFDIFL